MYGEPERPRGGRTALLIVLVAGGLAAWWFLARHGAAVPAAGAAAAAPGSWAAGDWVATSGEVYARRLRVAVGPGRVTAELRVARAQDAHEAGLEGSGALAGDRAAWFATSRPGWEWGPGAGNDVEALWVLVRADSGAVLYRAPARGAGDRTSVPRVADAERRFERIATLVRPAGP